MTRRRNHALIAAFTLLIVVVQQQSFVALTESTFAFAIAVSDDDSHVAITQSMEEDGDEGGVLFGSNDEEINLGNEFITETTIMDNHNGDGNKPIIDAQDEDIRDTNPHLVIDEITSSDMIDFLHSQEDGNDDRNTISNLEEKIIHDPPPTTHSLPSVTIDTTVTTATSSSHNPSKTSQYDDDDDDDDDDEIIDRSSTTYERIMLESLFQSNIMEYDMMKFDPFSFSGAPLGGWGRATRSRLATLPLRLVVGKDGSGGIPLLYGERRNENNEGMRGANDALSNAHGNEGEGQRKVGGESKLSPSQSPSTSSFTSSTNYDAAPAVRQSIGPHFSIHDAMGQKYVCRAYAEDELIVSSRIDSIFNPAITIWENMNGGGEQSETDGSHYKGREEDKDEKHAKKAQKKKTHFVIQKNRKDGVHDTDKFSEAIRTSVVRLLRKLNMNDAADELLDIDIDVDGEDLLLMSSENIDGVDGNDVMSSEIANIIKAAALGAGMGNVDNDEKNEGSNDVQSTLLMPSKFTHDQIMHLVQSLRGICSQFYDGGWWSYELCHLHQFRQFHVDVAIDSSGMPKYQVRDVNVVGKFYGDVHIIHPKGVYSGEFMPGAASVVKLDDMGVVTDVTHEEHDLPDGELYPDVITAYDNSIGSRHGSPIVFYSFQGGDFCDDVGHNRQAHNEVYCCTESFINHWLKSRNQLKQGSEIPKAVVLSVEEVGPCVYQSRVCTSMLCPNHVADSSSDSETLSESDTSTETTGDPVGALLSAIFGEDTPELGEIRIYFPDDLTGQDFDDLLLQANDGIDVTVDPSFQRVKEALRKLEGSKSLKIKDLLLSSDDEVENTYGGEVNTLTIDEVKIGGMSIRKILDMSLGDQRCLQKAIGWWTYEFCHGKQIRQYHVNNVIEIQALPLKAPLIETEHILGVYKGSGNSFDDYPNEDERLHVIHATSRPSSTAIVEDKLSESKDKNSEKTQPMLLWSSPHAGGNGAIYKQEYKFGEVCDHEDVAMSVIKGGNVLHGNIERSSTVRFMCGKRRELVDVKEDSTCHYILDVTVPELCHHELFRAEVTKTQVVKCLPV